MTEGIGERGLEEQGTGDVVLTRGLIHGGEKVAGNIAGAGGEARCAQAREVGDLARVRAAFAHISFYALDGVMATFRGEFSGGIQLGDVVTAVWVFRAVPERRSLGDPKGMALAHPGGISTS